MSRHGLFGFGHDPDDEPAGPSAFGEVRTLDFSVSADADDAVASGEPVSVPAPADVEPEPDLRPGPLAHEPAAPAPAAVDAPVQPDAGQPAAPAPVSESAPATEPGTEQDGGQVLSAPVTAGPPPAARPRPKARAYHPVRDKVAAAAGVALLVCGAGYAHSVLSDGDRTGPGAVLTAAGNVLLTGATARSSAGTSTVRVSAADASCAGGRGNEDLRAGTAVVVLRPDGQQVGAGRLDAGVWVPDPESDGWGTCRFGYAVPGVPDGPAFQVRVGTREPVAFPRDTITSADLSLQPPAG